MLDQDKILSFLKTTGPTLPAKVAKYAGCEIFIASAHLSLLASQGKIIISQLKVGGSPLYYLPGQEDQLYPFAAGNINPKELQVLELLKEEKVLRELDLDLLAKVALRSLKDFATPLYVLVKGRRELFWRWYLLPAEETKQAIGEILRQGETQEPEKPQSSSLTEPAEEKLASEAIAVEPLPEVSPATDVVEATEKPILEKQKKLVVKRKERKLEVSDIPLKEAAQQVLKESKSLGAENNLVTESKADESKADDSEKSKKKLIEKETKKETPIKDSLLTLANGFLEQLNISTKKVEVIRKNNELNLRVEVPSVVGKTEYFCKIRKKQRLDEKDVSAAYMEAQIQKLPLLLLYTDQIAKKAEEILKTEAFFNAVVKKIE